MSVAGNTVRLPALALACAWALAACSNGPPQALGTLEYDRITLPAPAAERIVAVDVRDGAAVKAGQPLLQLDPALTQARLDVAEAQAHQQQEALIELRNGPRVEDIAKARATLAAAEASAREAQTYYQRVLPLEQGDPESAAAAGADIDRARAAMDEAKGQVGADRAALDELLHGTRVEQLAQARAALAAAQAQVDAQRVLLDKLHIVAPRDGWVDDLPYKLGDQAPEGAPLAILLVGAEPYARIYVSERERPNVHVGDAVRVFVEGRDRAYAGKIRMLRDEPAFTPYYALIGDDASRLSYIAEVALGSDAAGLPAGVPVHVSLGETER